LFRDWQRTPTQSSATAIAARASKWMPVLREQEPPAERHQRARRNLVLRTARSRERAQDISAHP
jgi:hypothetical protein